MNAPSPPDTGSPPLAAGLPLFVLLALLGNVAGSALRYPEVGAAVLFPPYAVLTAALVVSRRRDWGWYVAAGAATHFATHWPQWTLSWVLLADAANIARALCAAALLRRRFGGAPRLDGIADLMLFVLSAVLVAPAVGATIGAANVVLHGASPSYWLAWRAWFMSNALTGLVMLPAFMRLFAQRGRWRHGSPGRPRVVETVLLVLVLGVTCAMAFLAPGGGAWHLALRFYAPLPVLIWAALRFGPGGASLALTAVAFAGIWAADRGTGPFFASSPDDNVFTLQAFMVLTSLPVLCIAAIDGARQGVVQLYRALLASLQDHVAILDARGAVIEVNDSWRRFADAVGDPWDGAGPRALAGVSRVLRRELRRFEMEYDRNDHHEAYALTVEALERADGGAVVTRADVTARREAEREVGEQRRELSHLARVAVLGHLSGALAHELNQPLAAILSNADAARHLLERQPPDLAEVGEILRDIAREDRRAAEVIQRLRALLRRGEARVQAVDAGELLGDVVALARSELITRRVTATVSVEPGLPPVLGDRVQLQQVLLNLILNGSEAMDDGTADRTLLVSARSDGGLAHLAVRDQGTGIPPELIGRLFEPFVTTKPEGLGLGLSISRTIVAAHGGRIWAENNPDRGATLHCLLAFSQAPSGRSAAKA